MPGINGTFEGVLENYFETLRLIVLVFAQGPVSGAASNLIMNLGLPRDSRFDVDTAVETYSHQASQGPQEENKSRGGFLLVAKGQ